jgi:hypothetical protein
MDLELRRRRGGLHKRSDDLRLTSRMLPIDVFERITDATALDVWVLNQLETLLHNATTNPTLDSQLREDKVVFFLHLLGLDTTGHSYRPHSKVRFILTICTISRIIRGICRST